MKYHVELSDPAVETFYDIKEQITKKWGSKAADEFEHRVLSVSDIIANSPYIFRALPMNANIRKGFIHRNCSMFYEIKEEVITILFFWDNRQDPIFL
jgi:plasmid stabilization system protein ParE